MQNEQKKKKGISDNTKLLIILGVVLLLMGVAFLVMQLTADDDSATDKKNDGKNGEVTSEEVTAPTLPATSSSSKIVDRSSNDVKSVEITTDTGENFTITYSEGEYGQTSSMSDADPLLKYSEDEMNTLSGYVGLLVAIEEVGEHTDDAMFGFDNPRRRIKITFKNDESTTLLLGKETPYVVGTDKGVYIRREDSNIVYTIGGSTSEILMKTKADYREIMIFDVPSSFEEFAEVTISRSGEPDLKVVKRKDDEKEIAEDPALEQYIADYKIVSPIERNTDNYAVEEKLFNRILPLEKAQIVEDYPKDLAVYGLDKPVKLKFKTVSGEESSLLIGKRTQSGGRYIMEEGIPSVGETDIDIDLSGIGYADISEKLLWFFDSTASPVFEYELPGGEKHTLAVWSENRSIKTKYDGKELSGSNGKNFFFYTVGMTLSGECPKNAAFGESAIKIKATFSDGSSSTIELLKLNERQYAAKIDGKAPQFYIGVDEVNALLNCFEIIKTGGTIPDAL